jgi:hypothetical protein
MSIYAIGMKGWVELRRCRRIPKCVETKATVVATRRVSYMHYTDDEPWGYTRWRKVPVNTTIKNIFYKGGKKIGILKSTKFAALTRVSIRDGGIIQVRPATYKILMKELS